MLSFSQFGATILMALENQELVFILTITRTRPFFFASSSSPLHAIHPPNHIFHMTAFET